MENHPLKLGSPPSSTDLYRTSERPPGTLDLDRAKRRCSERRAFLAVLCAARNAELAFVDKHWRLLIMRANKFPATPPPGFAEFCVSRVRLVDIHPSVAVLNVDSLTTQSLVACRPNCFRETEKKGGKRERDKVRLPRLHPE